MENIIYFFGFVSVSNGVRRMSLKARGSISKMERQILERAVTQHERDIDATLSHTVLTHSKFSVVKKKDFSVEVRAHKDVASFVNDSEVNIDNFICYRNYGSAIPT